MSDCDLLQCLTGDEERYMVLSGEVVPEVLDLVDTSLGALQNENSRWYFVKSASEGIKVGDEFSVIFDITRSGIVVPIAQISCNLRQLQAECGNYYEIGFYKENPQFKKLWGWRPLGLIEYTDDFPEHRMRLPKWNEVDRWQNSYSPFVIGTLETYQALVTVEPEIGIEEVREYLEVLREWLVNISTLEIAQVASLRGPYYLDARWGIEHKELGESAWKASLRSTTTQRFNFSEKQVDRLFELLERLWMHPITNAWQMFVDTRNGGFYGIDYADYVAEVHGEFYWLHFSWSD